MTLRASSVALSVVLFTSAVASAQKPDPKAAPAPAAAAAPAPAAGEPAPPPADPEETPLTEEEADKIEKDDPGKTDALTNPPPPPPRNAPPPRPRATKATYPASLAQRPITITRNTGEASLDVELVAGGSLEIAGEDLGPRVREVVRARFGITQDLEIFVGYGVGSQRLSPPDAPGVKKTIAGKQFDVGLAYTIWPEHLGVSVSVPMLGDPFVANVSLGVPFRFNLTERLAIVGGQDLVQLALGKWPVDVAYPERTEALSLAEEANAVQPDGVLNLQFGAIFALKDTIALTGTVRLTYLDFSSDEASQSLWLGAVYTHQRFDLGARLGFAELDVGASFGLGLFGAFRL